jgi:SAM-dependent methyltransferase
MYKKVMECRICGNTCLIKVLDLGEQMLTGVFPASCDEAVTTGPLQLVKCHGDDVCGLLQLAHSYELSEMYGHNYGYRSGLNPSMVEHLTGKVRRIHELVSIKSGDLILDIGSNDGTTLNAYAPGPRLVGVDPTGLKFRGFYRDDMVLITDFFSAELVKEKFPGESVKVVTSFSMFYDLESPMDFMRQVHEILADDGIWVFEQSYMPLMLETGSFDTVCHEHLEFYALAQIKWMTVRVGFDIVDVELNDINGGSFSVTVKKAAGDSYESPKVIEIIQREQALALNSLAPYQAFEEYAVRARSELIDFIRDAKKDGKKIAALGASTKGNVLLQYCGITKEDIFSVGEVNPDKFGCFTPGTWLPIVEQSELIAQKPDYLVVLPWHFRKFFKSNPRLKGMKLVFPLPKLEVVTI